MEELNGQPTQCWDIISDANYDCCCDLWTKIKNEINADRTIMVNIPGHSTCGVGYNTSSNTVITHYTHDPPNHLVWINKDDVDGICRFNPGGDKGKALNLVYPLGRYKL